METFRPVEIKEYYIKRIASGMSKYFDDNIFAPIFEILKDKSVLNAKDDLINALKSGKIYYKDGAFRTTSKFSNSISLTLEKMGAKFRNGAYYIKQSLIPVEYLQALGISEAMTAAKLSLIANFLNNLDLSKVNVNTYIKAAATEMFKSLEIDIAKSMQEKKVPIIELDIVKPKIQLPEEKTKPLDKYWRDYEKQIEIKRKEKEAAREAEKKGKTLEKSSKDIQEEIKELNKKAFENQPQIDFQIDKYKLDEQSKTIAEDYIYNMNFWVKKWETKNIIKMRKDIIELKKKGARIPEIQDYFEKRWKIGRDKAAFLARNESNFAGSVITKTQYKKIGATQFKWGRSSAKEKRELHKKYYGKVFDIDNPPIIDEKLGIKGLPRQIWNCLCHMLIIVPTLTELQNRRAEVKNSKTFLGKIKNAIQNNKQCINYSYRRFGKGQAFSS